MSAATQSDVHCTCPEIGHDLSCPWVRGEIDGEIVGHIKSCPVSGDPCPCLHGSLSEAYCLIEAGKA